MSYIEYMENRRLFSVAVDDGTLRISTAGDADVVSISLDSGTLHVSVNGQVTDIPKANVKRISINTSDGDDSIDVHGLKIKARVNAGAGDDTVFDGKGNDRIICGSGDDSVTGNKGNDNIAGDDGNDTIRCGDGNDSADGGNGDDSIRGGAGNDELKGSSDNDWVWGEAGDDSPGGGDGEDHIYGGPGADEFGSLGTQAERKDYKTGEGDHIQYVSGPIVGSVSTWGGGGLVKNGDGVLDLTGNGNNNAVVPPKLIEGDGVNLINLGGVVPDTSGGLTIDTRMVVYNGTLKYDVGTVGQDMLFSGT